MNPEAHPREFEVVSRDRRLFGIEAGPADGPAVILLHHGLGSTRAWRGQLGVLAAVGYRALAYDRWGYGRSSRRDHLDLPDFSADLVDLLALLDGRGVRSAALVGHSDGGTLALKFTARWPGRVWALVVVAAHIYVEAAMIPGIEGVAAQFATDERLRAGLERQHGVQTEAVFRSWYDGWHQPAHRHWDLRPELAAITAPTLAIQGAADEHATPQHLTDLGAAVAGAQTWLVPAAGHMLPQDAPEVFNPRLLDFLAQHRPGGTHV